jgi:hypothetical protein
VIGSCWGPSANIKVLLLVTGYVDHVIISPCHVTGTLYFVLIDFLAHFVSELSVHRLRKQKLPLFYLLLDRHFGIKNFVTGNKDPMFAVFERLLPATQMFKF